MRNSLLLLLAFAAPAFADDALPPRLMLHGNMSTEPPTEEYLQFVERAAPDFLIMGVFDQRWYAATKPTKGKALDLEQSRQQWKKAIDRMHAKNIRLVGQMELFVVSDRPADREEKKGWFGYYPASWNRDQLGPRPNVSADDLLEKPDWDRKHEEKTPEGDAVAECGCRVNSRALRGCANNSAWRSVQKAMVKAALDLGVDGFMTNRNYFEHCACGHCQAGFQRWLADRYTPAQLKQQFGIDDLGKHPLCVVGTQRDHREIKSPLFMEKLRFARHSVHAFFQEVYVDAARKIKPDVLLSQWNHMAYFDELHQDKGHLPPSERTGLAHAIADERWPLTKGDWGKGESFFWYCNWGVSQHSFLDKNHLGDTTLFGKLLRSLAQGKPYVINKYDYYRPSVTLAEAGALGYLSNAVSTHWQNEADRALLLRYFDFFRRHDKLYRDVESYADVAVVFPRHALHAGDASGLEYIEAAGRAMLRKHLSFDIIPDDMLENFDLKKYRALVVTGLEHMPPADFAHIDKYYQNLGRIVSLKVADEDRNRPGAATAWARAKAPRVLRDTWVVEDARKNPGAFLRTIEQIVDSPATIVAPETVQGHFYRQKDSKIIVHLVNYNRREKAAGKSVSEREAPIPADRLTISMRLPQGWEISRATFRVPEAEVGTPLTFHQQGRILSLSTPGFQVYGVCEIERRR